MSTDIINFVAISVLGITNVVAAVAHFRAFQYQNERLSALEREVARRDDT